MDAGWKAASDGFADAIAHGDLGPADRAPPSDEQGFFEDLRPILDSRSADDNKATVVSVVSAMALALRDGHSFFIPGSAPPGTMSSQRLADLGLASLEVQDGQLVWELRPGSPAAVAGLRPGDIVVQRPSNLSSQLPDPGAELVTLQVRTGGSTRTMTVDHATGTLQHFMTAVLPNNIAYVRLYDFTFDVESTTFEQAIVGLAQLNPVGWIIDVRSNRGGSVDTLVRIAGDFGASGAVVRIVERSGKSIERHATAEGVTQRRPMVVLVNQQSESSAEVLASVLRDERNAVVIGKQTAGKVLASRAFAVGGGTLELAVGRIFAGSSKRDLNEVGVVPDKVTEMDLTLLTTGQDTQLSGAINYILGLP